MRIWVARPEPGGTRTGERVAALGHDPLLAPVLGIAATEGAPPLGPFAGLLLTSANALAASGRWATHLDVPVFAVGARTAALAWTAGFASVVVAHGDGAALARLVRDMLPPGAALLHAAGEDRKPEPAASLTRAGYRLTTFVAYAARPVAALPAAVATALAGDGPLGAALHYSRRSAATALALAVSGGHGGAFAALRHYCLSADVAAPLAEAGIASHFIAGEPSEDALLAGLPPGFYDVASHPWSR